MSVNNVGVWPGYKVFVYQAVYIKLCTNCFCISTNGSYILKIKSRYMLKRLVLLRFLDNVPSSSSLWQKEGEEDKWQQITGGQRQDVGMSIFVMTQNQVKTVV